MTATASAPVTAPSPASEGSGRFPPAYRFELTKLLALWRTRIALALCWIAPAALIGTISRQSSLPSDTLFGRWMGQTGWAGALVLLGWCCSWVLPLLVSLIAGDVFAAEDRLGTWRHLLIALRAPRRIFFAKALASLTVIAALVVGLAASGIVGGLIASGDRPLIGLDGHTLIAGHAGGVVVLAWVSVLAPTLAFAAIGLLGSVAFGRSAMGLLTPVLLALVLQVAQLLPLPVSVRVAQPGYAFLAWRGLFTAPAQITPLLIGLGVSLAWAVAATALAYRLFSRRDFTDLAYDGAGRRLLGHAVLPLAVLVAVTAGAIGATTPTSGSGITRGKLQASLATAFALLYRLQDRELHRPDVTEGQLRTGASCDKGGNLVADNGPGNDWRCVVTWHIPGATAIGSAIYQLDVAADGRYVADGDGPQSVNGFFQVHVPTGDAPNPLWQFDSSVDLLTSP